jgi:uncharacterized protein YneF (UPF0154 family)
VNKTLRVAIIMVVMTVVALVGFFLLSSRVESALQQAPYIAAVKSELRALVAAQDSFRVLNPSYAINVGAVWGSRAEAAGVQMRIIEADTSGFLAEGRHSTWTGRCVVAVGGYAGDSLMAGEPACTKD